MITAYFDNGRPHVSAHIEIPRLNITGTIPLLVDTGADNTCIHPKDGPELLIPYCTGPDGLKPQVTSSDLWAAIHDTKGPGRPSNQSVSRVMGALGYTSTRVRSTSDRARAWVLINPPIHEPWTDTKFPVGTDGTDGTDSLKEPGIKHIVQDSD